MAKLADFLDKLVSDRNFEKKYDDDAEGAMEEFHLNEDQKKLIRKGNLQEIRQELRKDRPGKEIFVFRVKMG